MMRKILKVVLCVLIVSGCSVLKKKEKYGCPVNGRSVGAERLLSGDKAAIKAARKTRKFKS